MLPREKSDNFYHLFDGGDTGTKSAKVKKRVRESEALACENYFILHKILLITSILKLLYINVFTLYVGINFNWREGYYYPLQSHCRRRGLFPVILRRPIEWRRLVTKCPNKYLSIYVFTCNYLCSFYSFIYQCTLIDVFSIFIQEHFYSFIFKFIKLF